MVKKIYQFLVPIFVTLLIVERALFAVPVLAEDIAPTKPPSTASAESPTKPPSAPQPTSPPADSNPPAAPQPTTVNVPTQAVPTTDPSPTDSTQPTPTTSASQESTGSVDPSMTDSASSQIQSDSSNGTEGDSSASADPSTKGGSVNDPANVGTGPGSTNNASETLDKKLEVMNQNLADMQNKINAVSNSGFNYANFNTLSGQVFAGDATSQLNLMNKLNSTITGIGGFAIFNIYDKHIGDINFQLANNNLNNSFANASSTVSKNSVTGPESTNSALSDSSFTVKEANGNDAKLYNDITLEAITGGNSASYNTGNGKIMTGNAMAIGNIFNLANTNLHVSEWLFGVVNIFGTLAGNIVLPQNIGSGTGNTTNGTTLVANTDTGPLSSNNAAANTTVNETSNNTNTAKIDSNLDIQANTGNNDASVNTGGGSVQTGSSQVAVNNSTIANANTQKDDGTVWLVIVDKMGKWVGEIIGAPWGSLAASNALPISTETKNTGTGPNSENNASTNTTADSSITNNNTAEITNNIKVNADTGSNEAKYNTGDGSIQTGNAKAGLNLVNMVNTNVVAKKFVAVLVNVMGDFFGNVVTPGQQVADVTQNTYETSSPGGNQGGIAPTPTTSQTTSFDSYSGGTGEEFYDYGNSSSQASEQYSSVGGDQSQTTSAGSQQYNEALSQYYYQQQVVNAQKYQVAREKVVLNNEFTAKSLQRGIFLSPTFARATETSFPGILLGGVSFKVNQSWLMVIPLAMFVILVRRRRKINFSKYLNMLLDIVL